MTTIPENVTIEGVRFVRATRAERAEAALAACTERCNEHVQEASERAEVAQAKAAALAAERDEYRMAAEAEAEGLNEWQARAEKAEAKLDRVLAWAARGGLDLTNVLDPEPALKPIILTADMPGVQINGYDFIKGVLTKLPAADADRLISAGLAKGAS